MHASVDQSVNSATVVAPVYQSRFRIMSVIAGLLLLGLIWTGLQMLKPGNKIPQTIASVASADGGSKVVAANVIAKTEAMETVIDAQPSIAISTADVKSVGNTAEKVPLVNDYDLLVIYAAGNLSADLVPLLVKDFLNQAGVLDIKDIPSDDSRNTTFLATFGDRSSHKSIKVIARKIFGKPEKLQPEEIYIGKFDAGHGLSGADATFGKRPKLSNNAHEIGLESLVLVVHSQNPVILLSKDQIAAILTGMISDWRQVRSRPGKIKVYAHVDSAGSHETIKSLISGNLLLSNAIKSVNDPSEIVKAVSTDVSAVGLIPFPHVGDAKTLGVSVAGMTPVIPNRHTIATQLYPFSEPIYLYMPRRSRNWLTEKFHSFVRSRSGRKLLTQAGYIVPEKGVQGVAKTQVTVRDYQQLTETAMELSFKIRFDPQSIALNSAGERDIQRISEFLKELDMSDKRLMLFGFTDSLGSQQLNVVLSGKRANSVAEALKQYGIDTDIALGLGAQNPLASNRTLSGRNENRRVELWVEKKLDGSV